MDREAEISTLIATLHLTEQRLDDLTAGEVDAVADAAGRTILLRRAQDRLRDTEAAKQAAILNALPANIALLDPNGAIVSVNEAWRRFGLANELQAPGYGVGMNYLDICDGPRVGMASDARQVAAGIRSVLHRRAASYSTEYECHSPTQQRWFILTVTPLIAGSGGGVLVTHFDISQQKRAEREIRDTEERFRATFEQAAVGMAHVSPEGRYLRVNDKFCQLTGYPRADMLRLGSDALSVSGDAADRIEIRRRMIDGELGSYQAERQYRRHDGSTFWGSLNSTLVRDAAGAPKYFATVVEDITVRKEAQEKVVESERLLRIASSIARVGGWAYDVAAARLSWSDEVCNIHDVPLGTVPSLAEAASFYAPASRSLVIDAFGACIGDGSPFDLELDIVSATGRRVPVHAVGQAERDASGATTLVKGALQDLTLSRQAEQQTIARNEAEAANRAKSAFLATMSHEIRTPMNGVIGMLDVLRQTSLDPDQIAMVDLIGESALALLAIIEDILDFSKIEAGKVELERAPMSVAEVVNTTCEMASLVARKRGVDISWLADPAIPDVALGDVTRLRQVLVNLVGNAVKFSAGRPVRGRVSVRAKAAEIRGDELTVEFRVADNGIGMSAETLSRLFTPFTQADISTTRRFGGTGLGLAISKELVEIMGGGIAARSEPEVGSVFTFRIPFAVDAAAASARQADPRIAGLRCNVVAAFGEPGDDIAACLEDAGASVRRSSAMQDDSAIATAGEGLVVWVLVPGNGDAALERWREFVDAHRHLDARFVVLGEGWTERLRFHATDPVLVDVNVLSRDSLLGAVAAAAGRRSPLPQADAVRTRSRIARRPFASGDRVRRQKILVAEDNEINQKVILRQLSLLGYQAQVSATGPDALELWRTGQFALLLTDLQMPGLDGYDLTRSIRAAEVGVARIPIVALTANALKDENDRCLAAGMDDYLTKPARLESLQQVLERWLPVEGMASAPPGHTDAIVEGSAPDILPADGPAVDPAVLAALVGRDPVVIEAFLGRFRDSAAEAASELRAACDARSLAGAKAVAHRLKSSSRAVGARALAELCAEIESVPADGSWDALHALCARFDAQVSAVFRYLDRP